LIREVPGEDAVSRTTDDALWKRAACISLPELVFRRGRTAVPRLTNQFTEDPTMWKKLLTVIAVLLFTMRFAMAAVDINSASADELDKLKGIGPVKAKAIVDYRAKNGPFKVIEDVKKVPGIGDSLFETIKGEIAVGTSRVTKTGDTKRTGESAKKEPKSAEKGDRSAEKK
jgi:competence protein ComEA